jgi:hypothetical protein
MTYCVGVKLEERDRSRQRLTHAAGVDNYAARMTVRARRRPGAGAAEFRGLAATRLINVRASGRSRAVPHLERLSMPDVANLVSDAMRAIERRRAVSGSQ